MVVKNPGNVPFSSHYTYQRCEVCGFSGYAEKFKPPLWAICPKCRENEIIVVVNKGRLDE